MSDNFEKITIPAEISLLPVRNTVFFPNQFLPLSVGREKSLRLLKDAVTFQEPIGIISQKDVHWRMGRNHASHRTPGRYGRGRVDDLSRKK